MSDAFARFEQATQKLRERAEEYQRAWEVENWAAFAHRKATTYRETREREYFEAKYELGLITDDLQNGGLESGASVVEEGE